MEGYMRLGEAILAQAKQDYRICTTRLMENRYRQSRSKAADIHEYRLLIRFWETGCNGLVGENVLNSINMAMKVDTEKIDKTIARFEKLKKKETK